MDYLKILRRSLDIALKFRTLWIFGILLAIFAGRSGGCNFGTGRQEDLTRSEEQVRDVTGAVDPTWLIIMVTVIVILALFLLALGLFCRFWASGALIGSVNELEATGVRPTFRRGATIGIHFFWRLLGISFFIWVPFVIVLVVSYLPAIFFFILDIPWAAVSLLILAIIFTVIFSVVMGIVGGVVNVLADRQCVIGNFGVIDSIKLGFKLLTKNLGDIIIMWLSLTAIGCLFGCATGLVIVPAIILAVFGFVINIWLGLALVIPVILLFIAILVVSCVYEVFNSSAWTLTYRELVVAKRE